MVNVDGIPEIEPQGSVEIDRGQICCRHGTCDFRGAAQKKFPAGQAPEKFGEFLSAKLRRQRMKHDFFAFISQVACENSVIKKEINLGVFSQFFQPLEIAPVGFGAVDFKVAVEPAVAIGVFGDRLDF